MMRYVLWLLFIAPCFSIAQQISFTHRELFGGEFPSGVFKELPEISGWADDDHYLETRYLNGRETLMSVDARTGAAIPFRNQKPAPLTPPDIEGAVNTTLSPDGRYAAYTRDNDLYMKEISSGRETALTTDGSDSILNGYASWIYYEEILGRSSKYKAFWWSPDSRFIAFMRFDDSKVPVFPIYVADNQHGYLEQRRYPKPGDPNPGVKIGIVGVTDQSIRWADFDSTADQYFGMPHWTPRNQLWVQQMNRGQDTLTVYGVNTTSGAKKQVYQEIQSTWITLDLSNRFYFLPGTEGVIIKSDKDGWENLYLHGPDGKMINRITSGEFWGTTILHVDEQSKQVLFKARKENSTRFDIYKASFNGKNTTRLTSGEFSYDEQNISPSGKHLIATYSSLSAPPAMLLIDNNGRVIRQLGNSKGPGFDQYELPVSRLVRVKSADGKFDLPMTITYPTGFDSTKKYPVWITVYGGPDAGTVFDRWNTAGGYHQWWAQEGLIQVKMDSRSSGHFGKNGINDVYRQLGKYETEDCMAMGQWLRSRPWIDSSRIGITGGSFGGYLTCMALTYGADVFTHGIADFPVTDWQLYDSHYTERFMNTPQENPDGYKVTSAINYAGKYKGMLRIEHGTTDDNVHMQNSIQLISALQDLQKDFEVMIYPNERHGFKGPKEQHRIRESERFIYRYLLGK